MAERRISGGPEERSRRTAEAERSESPRRGAEAERPAPPRPDQPDAVAEAEAPAWAEGADPADLDARSFGEGAAGSGLDADLDASLGDRGERLGELADRDPIGDMSMPTEIGGRPAAGTPEEARDAGRSTAGADDSTGPTPTPYPAGGAGDDDKVNVDDGGGADAGVPMTAGDEAGSPAGVAAQKVKGDPDFALYSFDVKFERENVSRAFDTAMQNDPAATPAGPAALPSSLPLQAPDQAEPGLGEGPPVPIPGGWDPDDVVDGGSGNDLQGDGGYTDPTEDVVGAQMEGGPEDIDSVRWTVNPDAVHTDPSMLPETIEHDSGDIDPVDL